MDVIASATVKPDRRTRSRRERGVALVEVLFGVVAVRILAALWGFLFPAFVKPKLDAAVIETDTIRAAIELYRNVDASDSACPTLDDLVAAKKLGASATEDPWGVPYVIHCGEGDEIRVLSNGPDRQPGSPDDIHDGFRTSDRMRVAAL
jgi:hypothetical protein